MKPIVILLGCVTLAACTTEEGKPSPSLNMANPAAVYCLHVGGKLSTSESDAGKKGYCTLADGEHIDEWDLYRREHKQN